MPIPNKYIGILGQNFRYNPEQEGYDVYSNDGQLIQSADKNTSSGDIALEETPVYSYRARDIYGNVARTPDGKAFIGNSQEEANQKYRRYRLDNPGYAFQQADDYNNNKYGLNWRNTYGTSLGDNNEVAENLGLYIPEKLNKGQFASAGMDALSLIPIFKGSKLLKPIGKFIKKTWLPTTAVGTTGGIIDGLLDFEMARGIANFAMHNDDKVSLLNILPVNRNSYTGSKKSDSDKFIDIDDPETRTFEKNAYRDRDLIRLYLYGDEKGFTKYKGDPLVINGDTLKYNQYYGTIYPSNTIYLPNSMRDQIDELINEKGFIGINNYSIHRDKDAITDYIDDVGNASAYFRKTKDGKYKMSMYDIWDFNKVFDKLIPEKGAGPFVLRQDNVNVVFDDKKVTDYSDFFSKESRLYPRGRSTINRQILP